MWYPPQQQQQCWHGYIRHLSPQQQQQQTYSNTSYYRSSDESSTTNLSPTYVVPANDENESFVRYQSNCADDVYVTGTNYYVTTPTGSYADEMPASSLPLTNWNPVITAPAKMSVMHQNPITNIVTPSSSTSSSSSACWDWLLYPPDIYSHLYIPSSSFVQQQPQQDDDLDLLASLPTWLLALLYPSTKRIHTTDDENDSDQEISSLNNNHDEPLLSMNIEKKNINVSSNLSLSSENSLRGQKTQQEQEKRSSTPDTDDGYQSASDASRSDYSQQTSLHCDHHNSKDDITINVPSLLMPRRISYAAAVKPITTFINTNKISPVPIAIIKSKNNSSILTTNDTLNNGQKLKFIAPRFERMHHAKQYSTTSSSSSSTSITNRTQIRSNNNNNQRNHIINSTRRR